MEDKTEYTTTTTHNGPTTTTTYYTTTTTTTTAAATGNSDGAGTIAEKAELYDEEKDIVLEEEKLDHISDSTETHLHKEEYDQYGNHVNFVMSEAEKKLVKKLDYMYVMPYVFIINFLQYLDKSALNYSSVLGIITSAHISLAQFSWLGSIFYLGYLIFQGPSMILIQKLPLSKYVGTVIVAWGLVLMLTFLGHNFSQLAAFRFLLGIFEAAIYPCCIMLISSLYRRSEQATRIGLIYIANAVSFMVGGFIGYGIGHMVDVAGLEPWQWIMIFLGAITIIFGFASFFLMVDSPKAKILRLTPEEEKIVDERTLDNAVVQNREIKIAHVYESLKEPRYWAFMVCALLMNLQNSALGNFTSLITEGFGYTNVNAILLSSVPSGAADIIYISLAIWYNRRYGNTLYLASFCLFVTIIGLILLIVIPVAKVKLLGLYLVWTFASAFVMLLVSIANNVSGYTKKVFYSSSLMVFYTVGNFSGPFMMIPAQAPLYVGGMVGFIVADIVCIALFLFARWDMAKENRKRIANPSNTVILSDMTDKENKDFIYRL